MLTGELVPGKPIIHAEKKRELLHQLAMELEVPLERTVAVGDGSNDLLMMHAAGLGVAFNAKPKNGIAYLEDKGIIAPDPKDTGTAEEKQTKAIAKFLRQSARLDKKLLGEYISGPDKVDLLKAYMQLFDFKGVQYVSDLRGEPRALQV